MLKIIQGANPPTTPGPSTCPGIADVHPVQLEHHVATSYSVSLTCVFFVVFFS